MNNPYVWNRINPDLFYGRDKLLKDLIGDPPCNPYHSWSSFGVAGGRRMGKTTLLRRVEKDLQNGIQQWREEGLLVIPIYIDGLALPHPLSASNIWGLLFCELQSALMGEKQQIEPLDFDIFTEKVKPILKLKETPRIVVMFDEIERILAYEWNDTFLDNFRALINNTSGISEYLTAIFVGAWEMEALRRDVGSPLAGVLEWRYLGSFAYEDACRLMQEPIGDQKWPKEFFQHMYKETGGHPMLLQYMMQQICSNRLVVTESPSHNQLIEEAKEAASNFAKNQYGEFDDWWEKYCSPMAQRIYDRLVKDDCELSRSELNKLGNLREVGSALNILQHVGIATEHNIELMTYRYSGEMFRRWFQLSGYDPGSVHQVTESETDLDQEGPVASETYPPGALSNNSVTISSKCVVENFLAYYEKKSWNYARLAQLVAQFLAWRVREDFRAAKLPVLHQYTHRAKSLASLKANFDANRYDKIQDLEDLKEKITDLAGARLIFYFKDDLDKFCKDGIDRTFARLFGSVSTQARQISGSKVADGTREEKQGYESYHLSIKVIAAETEFFKTLRQSDQDAVKGLWCEVQLRTILQHAWAEAEHDLRYKPELAWGKTIEEDQQEMLDSSASLIYKGEEELSKCKEAFEKRDASQNGVDKQSNNNNHANNFPPYRKRYSSIDCRLGEAPNIKECSDIFNLDQEMEKKCQIKNYKQEIWKKLQEEKPQFITAIDRDPLLVRVRAWNPKLRSLKLQPAYYTDQAVTNHQEIIETKICSDKTIGSLSESQGKLLDFDESPMANTLGVSCVVTFEDKRGVLAYRSRSVAFGPEQIEGLGSGALEWTELGRWERDFKSWCAGGISRKLEEEIGNGASPEQFVYLGLKRDLQCAGKPQMFFLLNLDKKVFDGGIYSQWATYTPPKILDYNLQTEFRDLFYFSMEEAKCLAGSDNGAISRVTKGAVISDEFRMNLALALQYLEK